MFHVSLCVSVLVISTVDIFHRQVHTSTNVRENKVNIDLSE